MIESLTGLLAALKAATPPILIGIAIFCAVLLFSPPQLVAMLGLTALVDSYRPAMGGALTMCVSILFAQFIWWVRKFLLSPFQMVRGRLHRKQVMKELTPTEKGYLLRYKTNATNTQYFTISDGVAKGLVAKGVIYQAAAHGDLWDGHAFNLHAWVRRYFVKHPDALDDAGPMPTELHGIQG